MRPALARLLIRLYPRRWRERYGEEFAALLGESSHTLDAFANVVGSAIREHIAPTHGGDMQQNSRTFSSIVRNPSAYIPMAMSLIALAVVLVHIAMYGVAREADEGATAHIWQILMGTQLPMLVFFAIKWVPRAPRPSLVVLGLQAGAALASLAPVFLLGL